MYRTHSLMRNDFYNEIIGNNLKFQQPEEWLKTTCGTKNIRTTIKIIFKKIKFF